MSTTSIDVARRRSAELEHDLLADPGRFRVLTGDRPTGPLHLGHYVGTLANRVRLQTAGIEVFVVIADYQVITDRDSVGDVRGNVREVLLDHLAAGLSVRDGSGVPGATVFTHSAVPALNQLVLPFLSLVSVAELQRNPTVRAETAAATRRGSGAAGPNGLLLTYPVHQAADILFSGANLVPVGQDQLPHLETARLVARRFGERYGQVFPEPEALLSAAPLLLGTDGAKMSKSAGNSIPLRADEDETARLVRSARTDTERRISYDPVHRPEVANLLLMASLCCGRPPEGLAEEIGDGGSAALKHLVTESVNEHLRPLRARRRELAGADDHLHAVLAAGNAHANEVADTTLQRVREAMGMTC